MPSKTDKEILDLYQKSGKTRQAFRMLVENYQEQMYWIIRRMVLSHDDTNDILQDTFIKIWENLHRFRGDGSLNFWIYRIAINEVYNFFNKKKRLYNIQSAEEHEALLQNMKQDPYFDGDEARIKLQQAILKLPQKQQLVFNMRYFEKMQYEEMAKILETTEGSLKASYHWAVKKIENFLKND